MQIPAVQPYHIQELRSAVVEFFHVVPAGLKLEDVLAPSYWRNAWKLFENRKYSTIDLVAADNRWEAKVRILAADNGAVRLRVVSKWAEAAVEAPDGHKTEFVPGQGWRVLDADGLIASEGEPTEADAVAAVTKPARRKPAEPRRQPAPALKD